MTGVPHRARAGFGATVLGSVQSATIAELLDYTLTVSDNTEAEVLARLGAVAAGRPGSFAGAAQQNVAAAAALQRAGDRRPAVRRHRAWPAPT